jgi:hypothetical protein
MRKEEMAYQIDYYRDKVVYMAKSFKLKKLELADSVTDTSASITKLSAHATSSIPVNPSSLNIERDNGIEKYGKDDDLQDQNIVNSANLSSEIETPMVAVDDLVYRSEDSNNISSAPEPCELPNHLESLATTSTVHKMESRDTYSEEPMSTLPTIESVKVDDGTTQDDGNQLKATTEFVDIPVEPFPCSVPHATEVQEDEPTEVADVVERISPLPAAVVGIGLQSPSQSVLDFNQLNNRFNKVFSNISNLIQEYETNQSKILEESFHQSETIRRSGEALLEDSSKIIFDETIRNEDNDDVLLDTVTHSSDASILDKSLGRDIAPPQLATIEEAIDESRAQTRDSQTGHEAFEGVINNLAEAEVDRILVSVIGAIKVVDHEAKADFIDRPRSPCLKHDYYVDTADIKESDYKTDAIKQSKSIETRKSSTISPVMTISRATTEEWPLSTNTDEAISAAKALISKADQVLRESVVKEMLESRESEDLEAYSLRAFQVSCRLVPY